MNSKWYCVFVFLFFTSTFAFFRDTVRIRMHDGVGLYTILFFPNDTSYSPFPALLIRTPYNAESRASRVTAFIRRVTDVRHWVLAIQDLRGRYRSEGYDSLFREDGWGALRDGYETIEWIAAQSWCNGRVAMYGGSAHGIVQYLAAGAKPPHLVAAFPVCASWNMYDFVYQGGEFREHDVVSWVSSHSRPEMLELIKRNYNYSSWWDLLNCNTVVDSINVPMYHVQGWFDMFLPAQLEAYYMLQYFGGDSARGNQKLIIGPWVHGRIGLRLCGQIIFPPNAAIDVVNDYAFPWLEYWLSDSENGIMDTSNVRLYLMGPVDTVGYWNNWYCFDSWPFEDLDTMVFYLSGSGTLTTVPPATDSASYDFDPRNPVPTRGGHNLTLPAGIYDQSPVWNRADVLTFVSEVATKPINIFGRVTLKLFASSNRFDTDFTGKIVDIYPDGRKMLITDGILMARHRLGFDREDFLVPGEVYEFRINLGYTAYTIVPGHRLGLAVSSSNYPKYAVNPNTNQPVNASTDTLVARNTVYFGGTHASCLILQINPSLGVAVARVERANGEIRSIVVAGDMLSIKIDRSEKAVDVFVYDISGKVVARMSAGGGASRLTLRLPSQNGIYLIRVVSDSGFRRFKVLKVGG